MNPGANDGRTHVAAVVACAAAVLCAILLGLAVVGFGRVADGNSEIKELLIQRERPASIRIYETSWIDENDETCRVSVESEPGESPISHALRFEEQVAAMKKKHPRR